MAALGITFASLVGFIASSELPETTELAAFTGVLALAAALLWPLLGPVTQISKLSSE